MTSLRSKLDRSPLLAGLVAGGAGAYLGLCQRTIRWVEEGRGDLKASLAEGPVLLVTWHEFVLLSAAHWPREAGRLSTLHNSSPLGRVAGALHRRVGLEPMEMANKTSNLAASRQVMARAREGVSIGITGDGPKGPARRLKPAPLEWARVTGLPVWGYAYATSRARRLDTWDRMVMPQPFGRGAYCYARWDGTIPRRTSEAELAAAGDSLANFLTGLAERAEALVRA